MKHKSISLSIILILGITSYASCVLYTATPTLKNYAPNNQYDSFVTQLHQTQYAQKGGIGSLFNTPRIQQYTNQQFALISQPHMTIYQNAQPWHITADHGKSTQNGTVVYLWGHVKLMQPASSTDTNTIITTTKATVYPQQSYAKTTAPVAITHNQTTIHGTGAIANMKKGTIELLSQTQGHYVPTD